MLGFRSLELRHIWPARWTARSLNANTPLGIVVEDAPSGIKSGVASGAKVLAVCTSHKREEVDQCGATWVVTDLSK
jgi:glycerol 3-phosphatase-1